METDPYYLQHEKIINESWNEHYKSLEEQFSGMDEYSTQIKWGGGRFNSPPF